jgi:exosortase D (VPLPA-CTERM-specific)
VLVFASSVPITIVMNSARIATIGLFAELGNTSLAEGLLHDLQGWAMFLASGSLMLAETWLLVALFMPGRPWRDVLAIDLGASATSRLPPIRTRTPRTLVIAAFVIAVAAVLSYTLPPRDEVAPQREWLVDFPQEVGEWHGRQGRIEDQYLDALALDDYMMMDYTRGRDAINLYVAYYASQRQGESVHSPRACIPGGGWRITEFSEVAVPGQNAERQLRVNRAVIEFGNERQLVYYWFKQRERLLTNEYLVKWYIFFDSLTRRRSDGALVRLITPLVPGEPLEVADERLQAFARETQSTISQYVPD